MSSDSTTSATPPNLAADRTNQADPFGRATGGFRFDLVLLFAALVLAGVLHWPNFTSDALAIDEHVSFWIADGSSPAILPTRAIQYSATPGLSFVLQHWSLELFRRREWALRLPAALCFLGAIMATWRAGCRWFSPLVGGLAAILLATQPALNPLATAGRPYGVGLFIGVLAMLATGRVIERPTRGRWIVWGLVNFALVRTHYLFAALWGAEFAWLMLAARAAGESKAVTRPNDPGQVIAPCGLTRGQGIAWCVILFGLSAASVAPGLMRLWDHRQELNWTTGTPAASDLVPLVLPIERAQLGRPLCWIALALPLLWQIMARRFHPHDWVDVTPTRRDTGWFVRTVVWFVVPVAAMWLMGRFWLPSLADKRYLIIYVPAAAIVVARLMCLLRGRVAPVLATLALMLLEGAAPRVDATLGITDRIATTSTGPQQRAPRDRTSLAWKEVAELANRSGPCDLLLVGSGLVEMSLVPRYPDDSVFHDYATCRFGRMYFANGNPPRMSLPMFWPRPDSPKLSSAYLRAIARANAAARERDAAAESPAPARIFLVFATDTDLLRASAETMQAHLKTWGAVEQYRNGTFKDMEFVIYSISAGSP